MSNLHEDEPGNREIPNSRTGERPGGQNKDMLKRAAVNYGILQGVKYFWKELMRAKVGTTEIELQAMKNTRETIQRSVHKNAVPKRDEEAVVEIMKLKYKGVKKNVKEASIEVENLFKDCAARDNIEQGSRAWGKAKRAVRKIVEDSRNKEKKIKDEKVKWLKQKFGQMEKVKTVKMRDEELVKNV